MGGTPPGEQQTGKATKRPVLREESENPVSEVGDREKRNRQLHKNVSVPVALRRKD